MIRLAGLSLSIGIFSCLGMGCTTGGTVGVPAAGGPSGTVNQVTGERIITPTRNPDGGAEGIGTYALSEDLSGEALYDMFLDGDSSCIDVAMRIKLAINGAGELLALARNRGNCDNLGQHFVNVYPDATLLNGTQQPVRTAILEGPQGSIFGEMEMTIDRARDLIYVIAPPGPDEAFRWKIFVYEGVSTAAFDGMVSPTRTITLPNGVRIALGYLDSDDNFYWANNGILRLTTMSSRNGELSSGDIDVNRSFSRIVGLTLDTDERLWALSVKNNTLGEEMTAMVQRVSEDLDDANIQTLVSYEDFPESIRIDSRGSVYLDATTEMRIYDSIDSGNADTVQEPSRVVTNLNIAVNASYIIAN